MRRQEKRSLLGGEGVGSQQQALLHLLSETLRTGGSVESRFCRWVGLLFYCAMTCRASRLDQPLATRCWNQGQLTESRPNKSSQVTTRFGTSEDIVGTQSERSRRERDGGEDGAFSL